MPSDLIRGWGPVRVMMKWDWRRAASRAISRNDDSNIVAGAVAGLGGAIAIGAMEWFSVAAHYPLFVIPFATSIVLVIGSPSGCRFSRCT